MFSLITAAARALAAGDLLGALKRIAMRDDAPGAGATRHRDDACALGYFEDPASPLAFGRRLTEAGWASFAVSLSASGNRPKPLEPQALTL